MKGKTSNGFVYEVDDDALDNMELFEALSEIESNPIALTKVITLLFGKEQKKALYDHLRNENGKVPVEAVNDTVSEVFTALGTLGKNS